MALRVIQWATGSVGRAAIAAIEAHPDLTLAGWEYARVRVDTDAAALAGGLISTARELRAAMPDPPPLPPPVRELMRRNRTVDVHDPAGDRIVGAINPGREMREALLA